MSDLVLDALKGAGKPMKAGENAEATGIDKKEVDKQIILLKTEDKIFSPKRCFYDIKLK
jgi:hypothetical protein